MLLIRVNTYVKFAFFCNNFMSFKFRGCTRNVFRIVQDQRACDTRWISDVPLPLLPLAPAAPSCFCLHLRAG